MRIVSLLPSATEVVCALGRGADLVGRSEECDYPSAVQRLPVVMRARTWDAEQTSGEIDARVRRVRGSGASLYELDLDLLRTLSPDVLLTQDLCGVCSVTEEEVTRACEASGIAPEIVSLTPRRLQDVWRGVERIGEAIDEASRARHLAAALQRRTLTPRTPSEGRPRIAVVEWLEPPILAGLWTPDVVAAAGGNGIGPEPGKPGARTEWGVLARHPPDLLVLSPCSFSVDRTRRELARRSLSQAVAGVRPARGTFLADEAYFSRPGPRLADGVDLLRRLASRGVPDGPMPVEPWARAPEAPTT